MEQKEEKTEFSKQGNISLILDNYNDIFSDFDPRPYTERALSDDFLSECIKASRDKEGRIELIFMVPKKQRSLAHESNIRNRLRSHFKRHFLEKSKEIKSIKKQGIQWFFLGTVFILLASMLYDKEGFVFNLLEIMLTPAGWFSFWEGLAKVLITSNEKKQGYDFYKKMSSVVIKFESY